MSLAKVAMVEQVKAHVLSNCNAPGTFLSYDETGETRLPKCVTSSPIIGPLTIQNAPAGNTKRSLTRFIEVYAWELALLGLPLPLRRAL